MKKLLVVLYIIVISNMLSTDEYNNKNIYEIQSVTERREGRSEPVLTKINFINKKTNMILNSIDLFDDNPFNHLPFNKEKILKSGLYYTYYSGLKLSDTYHDFSWMYSPLYESYKEKNIGAQSFYYHSVHKNFVLVSFDIYSYYGEDLLGKKSQIRVYNIKGEEILRLENITDGAEDKDITDDGKFLVYLFGRQMYAYPRMFKEYPGIKIYEINSGKLIFKKTFSFDEEIGYLCIKNSIIQFSTFIRDDGVKKTIFNYVDPENRIFYSASLSLEISNRIKSFSEDGLILGKTSNRDTDTELYEFKKNFREERF
jgi:hypothetical protein